MSIATETEQTLYERDYAAWLEQQAALARAGKPALLDLANVAEELEDMSRRERRALESQLIRLLMHLLKWQFQPAFRSGSWHLSIRDSRRRIGRILRDSPSLRPYLPAVLKDCYAAARGDAAAETGHPITVFPQVCPYTPDQISDPDFLPD